MRIMSFTFFTFGGSQFWEDVFFYQRWRIQRNHESKKYRLLDPWDIVRARGSFEECRKAFVKYIEVYQLPRQKGHMIVMLHGLAGNKNEFRNLWRAAGTKGYLSAAINYPSTRKKIDGHVKQIEFLLNNMEDVRQISFVTAGSGALILRKLLARDAAWKEKIKVKRIVEISPPNQGSSFISYLSRKKFFRWLLGPMSEELTLQKVRKIPEFPENIETGIIFCRHPLQKLSRLFPRGLRTAMPSKEEAKSDQAKSMIEINTNCFNPIKNKKVTCAIMNFLDSGKFK